MVDGGFDLNDHFVIGKKGIFELMVVLKTRRLEFQFGELVIQDIGLRLSLQELMLLFVIERDIIVVALDSPLYNFVRKRVQDVFQLMIAEFLIVPRKVDFFLQKLGNLSKRNPLNVLLQNLDDGALDFF